MDLNNYIPLTEYAEKNGVNPVQIRKRIKRGTIDAVKISTIWFVRKDEPYVDHRTSAYSTRDRKAERQKNNIDSETKK